MKLIALLNLFLFVSVTSFAQKQVLDSLYKDLASQKTDSGRVSVLYDLSYSYHKSKPDSALILAQQAYKLAKKIKFLKGESWALNGLANAFHSLHNYPRAIEYFIEELKIHEKRGMPENMANTYISMALVYSSEEEYGKALSYAFKAEEIAKKNSFADLILYSKLNIGDIYEKSNQLSSAMIYTHGAYELSLLQKNDLITGTSLNNLGNIYLKRKDYLNALNYYRKSMPILEKVSDLNTLAECNLGLAKVYKEEGKIDSAVYYARKVYDLAIKNEFFARAVDASTFLVKLYKGISKIDSAFAYQEIAVNLSNSIDSKERAKEVQSITIGEEFRQKEIEESKLKEAEERKQKLQLLAIGIFIPILFFLSIFLSRRKISKKVIEFSGILSLLMLFEYLTLFIHPFVAEKSHHSPIIEIIVFVIIASLLTPTHHRVEHWLINKLTKYREQQLLSKPKLQTKETSEDVALDSENS
ncbi:tetratricopeptide repeat protein [Pedobacter lithocola]|uniref:Tetratricopeptide repeat protein n=1 Tax=Pedobacter lithocola TaxID=1908239 RepID=A0ABV8P716_9SPHI